MGSSRHRNSISVFKAHPAENLSISQFAAEATALRGVQRWLPVIKSTLAKEGGS